MNPTARVVLGVVTVLAIVVSGCSGGEAPTATAGEEATTRSALATTPKTTSTATTSTTTTSTTTTSTTTTSTTTTTVSPIVDVYDLGDYQVRVVDLQVTEVRGPVEKLVETEVYREVQEPTYRVGAMCKDGWRSKATGSGACSWHGGVSQWLMGGGETRTELDVETNTVITPNEVLCQNSSCPQLVGADTNLAVVWLYVPILEDEFGGVGEIDTEDLEPVAHG